MVSLCPSPLNGQIQDSRNFVESHTPPETFLFLIDVSGSMNDPLPITVQSELIRKSKLEEVKGRLSKLIEQLPDNERLIVTIFDHERKGIDAFMEQCRRRAIPRKATHRARLIACSTRYS
jgi:uncharacterized protein with von Willebrand factor type A (vWA) domain